MHSPGGDGAEVIYALRNNSDFSKTILDEIAKEGQNVRKNYQLRLPSNPIKDYYFIHRGTPNTEAVIVEYGFLDSNKDDVNQLKKNYENYAEAVVRAITKYKGLPYVAPLGSNFYTVQNGDSLWSIANKFGLTVNDLKQINSITSNVINVGDSLKVVKDEEKPTEDYLVYTVKKGDSLYKIASLYQTTVDTLMKTNNLDGSSLSINQQLLIPKNKEIEVDIEEKEGIEYIVKSGDNLYSIAKVYNTTVNSIKKANNLLSNTLSIGQKLIIPVKEVAIEEKEDLIPDGINYVVVKGDNLYSIANKYGVTIDDIKTANNLLNNTLSIGQVLKIPSTSNYTIYTVVSGDTLYKIANKFSTTVNKIMSINNLSSTNLSIGEQILIPTP